MRARAYCNGLAKSMQQIVMKEEKRYIRIEGNDAKVVLVGCLPDSDRDLFPRRAACYPAR